MLTSHIALWLRSAWCPLERTLREVSNNQSHTLVLYCPHGAAKQQSTNSQAVVSSTTVPAFTVAPKSPNHHVPSKSTITLSAWGKSTKGRLQRKPQMNTKNRHCALTLMSMWTRPLPWRYSKAWIMRFPPATRPEESGAGHSLATESR